MAILIDVVNTNNGNDVHVAISMVPTPTQPPPPTPRPPVDADADAAAVSKLVQLALGGIGVGTFSAGSTGAAYRDRLLAGAHSRAYEVAFFVSLVVVYLASVGEILAAARWVSLDGATAKKITFISFLLLLVLVALGLVSYNLLDNH